MPSEKVGLEFYQGFQGAKELALLSGGSNVFDKAALTEFGVPLLSVIQPQWGAGELGCWNSYRLEHKCTAPARKSARAVNGCEK